MGREVLLRYDARRAMQRDVGLKKQRWASRAVKDY